MPGAVRGIAYKLYERVELERALKGWSSTRLRTESGVSRSTIAKWATQPNPPLPGTVNAVADALGIGREEALRLAGILPAGLQWPDLSADEMRRALEMVQDMRAKDGERRGA